MEVTQDLRRAGIGVAVIALMLGVATGALAHEQAPTPPAGAAVTSNHPETVIEKKPNTDLIASGAITLGIPYVASVVAAIESSRHGDQYLYVPVVGPWLDFALRDDCPAGASCGNENAYKVLLVINGVLQGIGAAQMVGGVLFPVSHKTTKAEAPSIQIAPAHLAGSGVGRSGYGLVVSGSF